VRERERAAVRALLEAADVVLTTNTGAGARALAGLQFEWAVIDEAAQATEARDSCGAVSPQRRLTGRRQISCWIPLLRARRAVLAGDHCQLPPTVRAAGAERLGLARTLFERLAARFEGRAVHMLTVQYRMHATIMQWASDGASDHCYPAALIRRTAMYAGRLQAAPAVAGHLLRDLAHAAAADITSHPMMLVRARPRVREARC
jgi:ATP-dependent RNA/DNA helicase IGHMBP2